MNYKVRGAKKHSYNNIEFDSGLEVSCYKALESLGIAFEYNQKKLVLLEGFRLDKVSYYQAIYSKKRLIGYGQYLTKKQEKLLIPKMTYTPDFSLEFGKYIIYIETKGNENDVYPYKRKIFFDICEKEFAGTQYEVLFFEPRNVKQIKESLTIIKTLYEQSISKN